MSDHGSSAFYDLSQSPQTSTNEMPYELQVEQCLLETCREEFYSHELESFLIRRNPLPMVEKVPQKFTATNDKTSKMENSVSDFRLDSNTDQVPSDFIEIEEKSTSQLQFSFSAVDSLQQVQQRTDIESTDYIDSDTLEDQRGILPTITNKLRGDDQKRITLIKNLFMERPVNTSVNATEELREKLLEEVAPAPRRQPFEKIWNKKLSSKRCNQTRYVTTLLKLMSQAQLELLIGDRRDLVSLPTRLETCTKIVSIQTVLRDPRAVEFKRFVEVFMDPAEGLIVQLLSQINYAAYTKMLILEAVPVVRLMLSNSKPINSWKVEKVEVRGQYTAAMNILEQGGCLEDVKAAVEKEYLRIQPKLRAKSCSANNNTTHYQVQATSWMLERLIQQLSAKLQQSNQLGDQQNMLSQLRELKNSIEQLKSSESRSSIKIATKPTWMKMCILDRFISSGELLRYFLSMTSVNALCIRNLVVKFEDFVQTLLEN